MERLFDGQKSKFRAECFRFLLEDHSPRNYIRMGHFSPIPHTTVRPKNEWSTCSYGSPINLSRQRKNYVAPV